MTASSFQAVAWLELVQLGKSCHDTLDCACGSQSNEATGFSKTKLMIEENEANNNFDFS